ncbi:PAC2 family-domain-containing protein [Phycomyces nitens]|nr:PAC2 family-domain-containing protein [Phycomyces nitens]
MDTFVATPKFNIKLLEGSTLVLPTVSIGNVPQLACDLIIHTLHLERIGFLDDDSVFPVAGAREETGGIGVSVPIEVFQSQDHKWTIIQQRAPAEKGKKQQFLENIQEFVKAHKFSQVVLLTSIDASRRIDAQINSVPFRVLGTGKSALSETAISIGVPQLEHVDPNESETEIPSLPGSGLTRQLFRRFKQDGIPATILAMFALEGDNVSDSIAFVNFVNTLLGLKSNKDASAAWTPPKSWEYLFGTPFNAELYQ